MAIFVPVSATIKENAIVLPASSHKSATNVAVEAILPCSAEYELQQQQQLFQLPLLTPVKVDRLEQLLQDQPNQHLVHEVLDSFKNGFSLKYRGPRSGRIHKNLSSAFQHPKQLQQHLDKEISLGRILGPFKQQLLPNLICSPV